MLEVCFEKHNKVLVEKGRISEVWPGPCRTKEAVAKQRQVALERRKINRCGRLVWSEMSYSILSGLYLLSQNVGVFCGSWVPLDVPDVIGHLGLVNWIELLWTVTLGLLSSQSPREKAPDKEILSGVAENLLSGHWIKRSGLPCSLVWLCLGRVRVLHSVISLVCRCVLWGIQSVLQMVVVCHLVEEQRN